MNMLHLAAMGAAVASRRSAICLVYILDFLIHLHFSLALALWQSSPGLLAAQSAAREQQTLLGLGKAGEIDEASMAACILRRATTFTAFAHRSSLPLTPPPLVAAEALVPHGKLHKGAACTGRLPAEAPA